MERAIDFYQRLFGQPVTIKDEIASCFDIQGFRLFLFANRKVNEPVIYGDNCLLSIEVEDIGAIQEKLASLDAPIAFPPTKIGTNWFWSFRIRKAMIWKYMPLRNITSENSAASENKWLKQSRSCTSVAVSYDRYRPGYPTELPGIIQSVTGIPRSGRILEIGSGTGKATELFAANGYTVHRLEPGNHLVDAARKRLAKYPAVTYEVTRFEDWKEKGALFDLAASAQAFHWVDPAMGYSKASKSLKTGGWIALFWNMPPGFASAVDQEIDSVYAEWVPELAKRRENTEERIRQREEAIRESGEFTNITVHRVEWSTRYTADQYIGLLGTSSDHICLAEKTRQNLYAGIAEVFRRNGGILEKPYLSVLYLGKKAE